MHGEGRFIPSREEKGYTFLNRRRQMGVGTLLACALALQGSGRISAQDPRDRLTEAIRHVKLADAQAALGDLAAGDPVKAARGLIPALSRCRDRLEALLRATVGARQEYDRIETSFTFNLEEEKLKNKALEASKLRIKQACAQAIEGEKIYEAIREILGLLGREAAPVLAAEVERTASWLVKCELLEALGRTGAEGPLLAALEREREPVVLAAALSGLASEKAERFLSHAHWQVRWSALQGLRGSRRSVGAIVGALSADDARFRNSAVEALASLTGTRLPADPGAWKEWWKANGADFDSGAYRPGHPAAAPGPGRTTFYDVPIVSNRICFVVDRSRSMKEQNRFETAKLELKALLDRLPDGSRINILFFGGSLSTFARSTRILDAHVRREAAFFIDRQLYEPATDLYQALERALSYAGDPDSGALREGGIDTIIVLSDGQATTGRLIDDELVARVIARRARFLRPVIHAVSLSREARSLQMLSEFTGGEYRTK